VTIGSSQQRDLPAQSFDHDISYRNLIDAQFSSRALATKACHIKGARWSTHALYPSDGPEVIASSYFNYNRSFEALANVGDALAHVIRQGDSVTIRLAAKDRAALDRAEAHLREQLPEPDPFSPHEVDVEFSYWHDQRGASVTTRTLAVPTLSEIERNYSQHVRSELRGLAKGFRPGVDGRLLLWHGHPGSGKTWALRALASEWRDWCRLRYVSDPERLLNDPGYLVDLIHTRPGLRQDGDDWRLVVLEDTGELLAADAKERSGQGLSRLLNVVDGLLGESSQAFFLVTTNEDLRSIHPAVARPGRCGHVLEFEALQPEEASLWLAANDSPATVAVPATLAELFAIRDGKNVTLTRRRPVGFS
jgi:hypothetical protein